MIVITVLNVVVVIMAYLVRFRNNRILLAYAFLLLAIVLGIRYDYGNDYKPYYEDFIKSYTTRDEYYEYGWYLLYCLFHPFGFFCLVFTLTCVENFIIYKIIEKYVPKEWIWFAVFIYVFNMGYLLIGLSMMRQFLVMCIGLYSLKYVANRNLLCFLILCSIATFFHTIAILLFPLYFAPFFAKLFDNKWGLILIFLGAYIIYIHIADIVLSFVIGAKENDLAYGHSVYMSAEEMKEEKPLRRMYIVRFIIFLIFYIRNIKAIAISQRIYSVSVFLSYFVIPFVTFFTMAIRASWVYSFAEIVAFPLLLSHERNRMIKVSLIPIYLFSILFEYFDVFSSSIYGAHYMNYHTIFETL